MTFSYCLKRALFSRRFWLAACFGFVGVMLFIALALSFGAERPRPKQSGPFPQLHMPRHERKPSDECTDYAPEKAHPNWFACPISEQRMGEM